MTLDACSLGLEFDEVVMAASSNPVLAAHLARDLLTTHAARERST